MYSWTYYCNFYELKLSSNTQKVDKLLWPDFFQESNLVLCSKKRCLEKQQNSHDLLGSCRQTSLNLYVPPLTFHYTQTRAVTSHPLTGKPFSQPQGEKTIVCYMYLLYVHLMQSFLTCEFVYKVQSYCNFTISASGRKIKLIYIHYALLHAMQFNI